MPLDAAVEGSRSQCPGLPHPEDARNREQYTSSTLDRHRFAEDRAAADEHAGDGPDDVGRSEREPLKRRSGSNHERRTGGVGVRRPGRVVHWPDHRADPSDGVDEDLREVPRRSGAGAMKFSNCSGDTPPLVLKADTSGEACLSKVRRLRTAARCPIPPMAKKIRNGTRRPV